MVEIRKNQKPPQTQKVWKIRMSSPPLLGGGNRGRLCRGKDFYGFGGIGFLSLGAGVVNVLGGRNRGLLYRKRGCHGIGGIGHVSTGEKISTVLGGEVGGGEPGFWVGGSWT